MAENITYLAKLGELTLKGSNLKEFENRLTANVRFYLQSVQATVRLCAGRLYIQGPEESCPAIEFTLRHLIGITGWARTAVCDKDIMAIRKAVFQEATVAKADGARSFKIESRRADKNFPLNSYQISCEAATDVVDQQLLEVNLHHPDVVIRVEVRDKVFVYCDRHKGCRGLPVGTGGHGLLLLSGGLDSPVAGYRMMRRGMKVDCVYFHAYPYTSAEAQQKVEDLAKIIARYGLDTHINIIPFTEVQMRIRQRSPENFSTLLLRMCMMRAATLLADRIKAHCLISGESLGQVASQTVQNMAVTESASTYPLLRPLVGLDKEEIVETAKAIGTYDTSILPYEDCCVLFSPKHPVLKASVEEAQRLYQELEVEELIQAAYDQREHKKFSVQDYIAEHYGTKE